MHFLNRAPSNAQVSNDSAAMTLHSIFRNIQGGKVSTVETPFIGRCIQ